MSELSKALFPLIQDAIYDARNAGQTIGIAAEKAADAVVKHVANELTHPKYDKALREAWLKADAEGRAGERVEAGLAAVARAVTA